MTRKMVDVEVEVDLSDFTSDELIAEIEFRGHGRSEVKWLIAGLERCGCPREYLEEVKDWAKQPVVDKDKLDAWLEMVGKCESNKAVESEG